MSNNQIFSLTQMAETIHVKDTFTLQINSDFLNHNFIMIKQCLLKVQQLNNQMTNEKSTKQKYQKQIDQLKSKVLLNQKSLNEHQIKIKELQNNIGDGFMKKIYQIQTKSKSLLDFDQTVSKLKNLNVFAQTKQIKIQQDKINLLEKQNQKVKDDLSRYVEEVSFEKYQDFVSLQLNKLKSQINFINSNNNQIQSCIDLVKVQSQKACQQVKQNNLMLKQINFTEMQQKIKKFRQDTEQKVAELSLKLKKKCALTDLGEMEKNIIEKLDKFLISKEKTKASLNQTKDALIYLQKRLNEIYQLITAKQTEDQNDALFSAKKIHCASCTKDLGKFEGKLGQYKPWAIFPCKQLDPEKTGGYGFVSYIDKMTHRRGNSTDDSNLQRLNKTFFEKSHNQEDSPTKKMNSTRATNFMQNYGQDLKNTFNLKDQYFKELNIAEKNTNKIFRVKKDAVKPSTAIDSLK